MITNITKQGGRKYPQMRATSINFDGKVNSVSSAGAVTFTAKIKRTLSATSTRVGSRQTLWN